MNLTKDRIRFGIVSSVTNHGKLFEEDSDKSANMLSYYHFVLKISLSNPKIKTTSLISITFMIKILRNTEKRFNAFW